MLTYQLTCSVYNASYYKYTCSMSTCLDHATSVAWPSWKDPWAIKEDIIYITFMIYKWAMYHNFMLGFPTFSSVQLSCSQKSSKCLFRSTLRTSGTATPAAKLARCTLAMVFPALRFSACGSRSWPALLGCWEIPEFHKMEMGKHMY